MTGQGLVLLAVGVFTSLVITAASVDHYLLSGHPVSEVDGLLWRVENTLGRARDLEIWLASTQYGPHSDATVNVPVSSTQGGTGPETVRMVVRAVLGPSLATSVQYTEPESMAGEIITSDRDLLSHYLPRENLLVVKRWAGIPLTAVGLAGLDVSHLRAQWKQNLVDVRIQSAGDTLTSDLPWAGIPLASTLAGTPIDTAIRLSSDPKARPVPDLVGFAGVWVPSYEIEVLDKTSGRPIETVWIDRGTYLIRKIVFFEDQGRVRTLEVERLVMDQGLTSDEVLVIPAAAVTIGG